MAQAINLTRHAETRCQQRGLKQADLMCILRYADIDYPVGDHCTLMKVSAATATHMNLGEKVSRYAVIVNPLEEIVTALPVKKGKRVGVIASLGNRIRRTSGWRKLLTWKMPVEAEQGIHRTN